MKFSNVYTPEKTFFSHYLCIWEKISQADVKMRQNSLYFCVCVSVCLQREMRGSITFKIVPSYRTQGSSCEVTTPLPPPHYFFWALDLVTNCLPGYWVCMCVCNLSRLCVRGVLCVCFAGAGPDNQHTNFTTKIPELPLPFSAPETSYTSLCIPSCSCI